VLLPAANGCFALDALNSLDDIGQSRDKRHNQNTRSAEASIYPRKTGCRLAHVMISAFPPENAWGKLLHTIS